MLRPATYRTRWRASQHSATRRDLNGGDASAVKHDEPITVSTSQRARILGKCRDDVFNELVFVGDVGFVVRDIHAVPPISRTRSTVVDMSQKLDQPRDSRPGECVCSDVAIGAV